MTGDLTARVAELAALIEDMLADEEVTAEKARKAAPPPWLAADSLLLVKDGDGVFSVDVAEVTDYRYDAVLAHAASHDPGRALRRVKATRDLVAAILAEPHADAEVDSARSCSQVLDPRAGKPCDCGRDQRVARLLGIIASEWEA